jgi:peptide deformylase
MAIRNIRIIGDEVLTKRCKEVSIMTPRIKTLIDDMIDTMNEANGVGLAACQVGVLKRIVVIDTTGEDLYVLINPEILETSGEQEGYEGCLSVPGLIGKVKRPLSIKVNALDRDGIMQQYTFTDFEAVVASHEIDHLDGILYTSKATDIHEPKPGEMAEPDGDAAAESEDAE